MSIYKLDFYLKQHTPIIHFQHDEVGATLRASELKPKLDKFLIDYLKKNSIDPEKFLIKNTNSFNYKIKITIKSNENEVIDLEKEGYSAYFGNIGNSSKKIKGLFNKEKIKISFIFYNEKLKKLLEENFSLFLILHNFGTRQNKGFGCFYLDSKDINYKTPIELLKSNKNKFIYGVYNNQISLDIAKNVPTIYSLMKSGLNFPDLNNGGANKSYYKSFLFEYMLKKGIGNEKRFIKENFFSSSIRIPSDGITKKYVRALLGISEGILFRDRERNGEIKYKNISDNEIERFQSPILFKIINNTMFIIPEEINSNIFDSKFTFNFNGTDKTIAVPSKIEFDIYNFIYEFADHLNNLIVSPANNIFNRKITSAKSSTFIQVKP